MKKLTGTILLTAVLLIHFAVAIATEESYIFSSSETTPADFNPAASGETFSNSSFGTTASPVSSGSLFNVAGMYSVDEQINP